MVTEVTASQLEPRFFVHLDFPSGAVRVWDGIGDKTYNLNTYTGVGTLGTISPPNETTEVRAEGCIVSLSGCATATISKVLTDKVRGRTAEIWLACLDGAGNIIADPITIFKGRMDHTTITESGEGDNDTCTINVHCESHLIDLGRASEWRYSHEHQQELFAGDDGFEYAASMVDMELNWMQKDAQRSVPVSSTNQRLRDFWRP